MKTQHLDIRSRELCLGVEPQQNLWLPRQRRSTEEMRDTFSLDHSIGSREQGRRNRQTDLLGSFQIDHQLEVDRLLDRKIARLGAFQDLIDIACRSTE